MVVRLLPLMVPNPEPTIAKNNNYNQKKIDRHLAYIEDKSNEYLCQLEDIDTKEDFTKVLNIQEKIIRLKKIRLNMKFYKNN